MSRTRHMMSRMNHRGIGKDLVDLVLEYGECQQDKYVLNRNSLERLLSELRDLERTVIRAIGKRGVVVVEDEGQLITTYTAKSYDRRRTRGYVRNRTW
jgi:hypothetical protein